MPKNLRRGLAFLACWLGLIVFARPLLAHPLAPALLELRELSDGAVEITWRQSVYRLPGTADKRPVLPAHCSPLTSTHLEEDAQAITAVWTVDCGEIGLINQRVGVEGLADTGSDALVRVRLSDGRVVRGVVGGDKPYFIVPERESRFALFRDYAGLGIEHILTGPDHLLFVFGLILLVATTRSLLVTITAFTVGHSITLSLAMLGLAQVPSGPIEVLIAASVFVLAVELASDRAHETTLLGRRPWLMAGMFGLLHGLGFAGALREVGLPEHEIPLSLASFNVGIEIGQVAFVLVVLVAARMTRPLITALPAGARRVPVYAMGSLATMWMIERSVALLG